MTHRKGKPPETNQHVIDMINQRMTEEKMSLADLTRNSGVQFCTLSRFMSGKTDIKLSNFLKIAKTLKLWY